MIEVEKKLDDEIVQKHIRYIQDHLDYLLGIHKSEDADYDDPTKITLTFMFMKQKVDH